MKAMRRAVIFNDVRLFSEVAGMPLVAMLRAAGTRPLPLCFSSVDGGFDEVREILSGCCRRSTNSTNSGFVSPSSSSRFTGRMNQTPAPLARVWVITDPNTVQLIIRIAMARLTAVGEGSPRRRSGKLLILRLTPRGLRRPRRSGRRSSRISASGASCAA
jgi:hypothetical protein